MDTLSETLRRALAGYAGEMLNGYSYLTTNADGTVFAIVGLGFIGDRRFVDTSLVARLEGNTIIIEHDVNNKPLVDALLADGIPHSQIILAYAGEPVALTPDPTNAEQLVLPDAGKTHQHQRMYVAVIGPAQPATTGTPDANASTPTTTAGGSPNTAASSAAAMAAVLAGAGLLGIGGLQRRRRLLR